MVTLGISAFYHDGAAALVDAGHIVAAAQEERFTRRKHDPSYPRRAVAWCLGQSGRVARDIDRVVFYDKPFLKFERLIETYVAFAPRGFRSFSTAVPLWIKDKLFQKNLLKRELRALDADVDWDAKLLFAEHHQSHAASAFYPSPFRDAVVLTMDGVGEWTTTSVAIGHGRELDTVREIHFPHSIGLLYSAFTYYIGFKVNSGEYKVMGLAPFGEPRYAATIRDNLIDVKEDGTFRLNMAYFDFCTNLKMTNARFDRLFGGAPRRPRDALTSRHMDLAASVQAVVEDVVLRLTRSLRRETGIGSLCLAGGVALNCVANGKILRDGRFDDVWVQPAAGDAGGALGAALVASHRLFGEPRRTERAGAVGDAMQGAFLGPGFTPEAIRRALDGAGVVYAELPGEELIDVTVTALADGYVVGWFQGRMEFGPRALGNRSILADARSPTMQKTLNLKIKRRESFRPFAPSVLRADVTDWFDLDGDSPYMLFVVDVANRPMPSRPPQKSNTHTPNPARCPGPEVRSDIPAVTHVDHTARVQTVHPETNPRYHALLEAFKARTGCPVLVNTSFNVRGEPIVCTPDDALRCFLGTDLDGLAIGNCWLRKADQPAWLRYRYGQHAFEPD